MSFRTIISFTFLLIFAGVQQNSTSADNKYQDAVEKLKKENKQMVEALKKELKQIQQEIKDKNYKFRVGMTEAFKFKISEINGYQEIKEQPTDFMSMREESWFVEHIKILRELKARREKSEQKISKKPAKKI